MSMIIDLLEALKDLGSLYEVKGPFSSSQMQGLVEDDESIVAVAVVDMDVKILFARGNNIFEYKNEKFRAVGGQELSYKDFLSEFLNVEVADHDEVVVGTDDKKYVLAV